MRELATCLNVVKRVKFYILYFKNCNIVYWEKKRVEKEGKKIFIRSLKTCFTHM